MWVGQASLSETFDILFHSVDALPAFSVDLRVGVGPVGGFWWRAHLAVSEDNEVSIVDEIAGPYVPKM